MKKILNTILAIGLVVNGWAQTSGGPDTYGYTYRTSKHPSNKPPVKWVDISNIGTQVTGLSDDNVVGPFNSNANFRYYWYTAPKFWIGSNGYITFDGDNISSPFPAIVPSTSGAQNFIAGLLSDLNFAGSTNPARCYYWSNADSLVVSFEEVPYWYVNSPGFTGENSFQIVLNAVDSSITITYGYLRLGNQTFIDNVVGIENISGAIGLSAYIDSIPPDTSSVKFYYPPVVTYQAIDLGVNWVDNEASGGSFWKADGAAYPLWANVKNYGNVPLSGITVYDTVYDPNGNAVASGMATVGYLDINEDTTIIFNDSFAPTSDGIYTNSVFTDYTGDVVTFNNTKDQEMVVVDTSSSMLLEYTDGNNTAGGLSWNGGNGGIAIYIKPPIYPAKIKKSRYYISNTANNNGFHAVIYDDNGPNGGHGTTLDSILVSGSNITTGAYNTVNHDTSDIVITSGGVYLMWYMDGPSISLGRTRVAPISRRSIEVIAGGWGGYRDLLVEDFQMGIEVDFAYPRADFFASTSQDPEIAFTDKSTNDPTKWFWEFGDGNTDTVQNPNHTYDTNGTYEVCLTVSNQWGSNKVCKNVDVTGAIPQAYFTYNDSAFPTIAFKDESLGPPTAWEWNMADTAGPVVMAQNPVYRFRNNGTRLVCLTAINVNGSSAPYCEPIEITGVGIDELEIGELSVRPNPFSNIAIVDLPSDSEPERLRYRVINTSGAEVQMQIQRKGYQLHLNRSSLPSGMYYLQFWKDYRIAGFAELMVE